MMLWCTAVGWYTEQCRAGILSQKARAGPASTLPSLFWWGELWSLWCHLKTPGIWLLQSLSYTEIFSVYFFLGISWDLYVILFFFLTWCWSEFINAIVREGNQLMMSLNCCSQPDWVSSSCAEKDLVGMILTISQHCVLILSNKNCIFVCVRGKGPADW